MDRDRVRIRPLHVGISVPDIEASIRWYTEVLGFTLDMNKFLPIANAQIAFLSHGDFSIELFGIPDGQPLAEERRYPNQDIRHHGTKHIAWAVEDLTSFMAELKSKNVDVAMDITPIEGDLVAFIRDNSGNLIELIQRPDRFGRGP
jgi:methylmalonyl-CoA/ethylmalonyl-CoA epimerase